MVVGMKLGLVKWYSGAPSAVGMASADMTECRAVVVDGDAPLTPDDDDDEDEPEVKL